MRILAHRGLPTTSCAENSVAAVLAGVRAGADGAEVDLRLSADGVLVVCHDPSLLRLTGFPLDVSSTDWADLRAAAAARDVRLARVEELLHALAGCPVVLEVKAPPPLAGSVVRTADAVLARVAAVGATGTPLEVTVSSFAPDVVAAVRAGGAGGSTIRTALLGRPTMRPGPLLRRALAAGHDEIHPHVGALLAEPRWVAAAHGCGVGVVAWTVNGRRAAGRLAALGVDAVITDEPGVTRRALPHDPAVLLCGQDPAGADRPQSRQAARADGRAGTA